MKTKVLASSIMRLLVQSCCLHLCGHVVLVIKDLVKGRPLLGSAAHPSQAQPPVVPLREGATAGRGCGYGAATSVLIAESGHTTESAGTGSGPSMILMQPGQLCQCSHNLLRDDWSKPGAVACELL